jgi:hypothetical protein
MFRSYVRKPPSVRHNGVRRWPLALPASLLLILILIGSTLAQQLSDTIDTVSQGVIREVSRYFADTPVLDAQLSGVGFQPNRQDASWRRTPAVRKIETAYLAAQTRSQADADRLLSRLAKETVRAYEPARSVQVLTDLAARDTPGPLYFAAVVKVVDPSVWSPPPAAQEAILEISRYADGGSLGGTANLMQVYFGVPDHEAYQILRTSNDSAEAIKRAMTFVPEAERNPRMTRIINDLGQSHPDAKKAAVFVAFLKTQTGDDPSDGTSRRAGPSPGPDGQGPNRPGGDSASTASTRPNRPGGRGGNGTVATPPDRPVESADIRALRGGISSGWVVTRNSSGKIFVHASSGPGYLSDLRYLIEESPDGGTWTVHLPRPANGVTEYGRTVGVIEKPEGVRVGACTCR